MGKNREFSQAFKVAAARRLAAGESGSKVHRELGVKRSVLYRWAAAYRKFGEAGLNRKPGRPRKTPAPPGPCGEAAEQLADCERDSAAMIGRQAKRIAELERLVGQQALDLDFLARAFKRVNESRPSSNGATASTPRSGK